MKHLKVYETYSDSLLDKLLDDRYDDQWVARVKRNIFAASENTVDIERALSEWVYTRDKVTQSHSVCNICSQPELVYIFKIRNIKNGNVLWIGSDCIRKFTIDDTKAIAIYDINGERIVDDNIIDRILKDDLKSLIHDAKSIRVLNILSKMYDDTKDEYYNYLYDHYANYNKFTPRQIVWLDNEMRKLKVEYNPYDFMVDISNPFYLNHVLKMSPNSISILKKYMNRDQLERIDYQLSKKVIY